MRAGISVRVIAAFFGLLFAAPTVIIVATSFTSGLEVTFPPKGFSFRWYSTIFETSVWTDAFKNSLEVGLIAALIATVAGTLLALGAARGRGILPSFITALAVMPMIVPLVIAGIGFYIVYVEIGLTGNALGLGIAHAMLGLPFVFINVLAALSNLDERVEDAARVCGANEFQTFLRVTLPLIAPGAIIGGVLAFIGSWDEVVVAIFMTTPNFHTVPVELWDQISNGVQPSTSAVAAFVTVTSLLLLGLIALVPVIRRKRPWARFRRA